MRGWVGLVKMGDCLEDLIRSGTFRLCELTPSLGCYGFSQLHQTCSAVDVKLLRGIII